MKKCSKCKKEKDISCFTKQSKNKDGIRGWCKECVKIYKKDYYSKPENMQKQRADMFKYTYNIIIDQNEVNRIFCEQNGECAICGYHPSEDEKQLSLDHNHKTGKIIAFLYHNCNLILGHAKEDITILQNAIKYISNFTD